MSHLKVELDACRLHRSVHGQKENKREAKQDMYTICSARPVEYDKKKNMYRLVSFLCSLRESIDDLCSFS